MAQYIDKSALAAEIERIKEMYCYDTKTNASFVSEAVITSINNAINTLEVKEVNINKEISHFIDTNFEKATIGHKLSLRRVAKYFFELGMSVMNKAQKGE